MIHCFILKLKILKHQLFILLIIGVCLIIVIISEVIIKFQDVFLSAGDFILLIFLLLIEMLGASILQAEEHYLMEFDSFSPANILLREGVFGFIISFLGFINDTPIEKLQKVYNNSSNGSFILFIFLCLIYVVLSGIYNLYKIHSISLYSTMAVSLAKYFLNPFF